MHTYMSPHSQRYAHLRTHMHTHVGTQVYIHSCPPTHTRPDPHELASRVSNRHKWQPPRALPRWLLQGCHRSCVHEGLGGKLVIFHHQAPTVLCVTLGGQAREGQSGSKDNPHWEGPDVPFVLLGIEGSSRVLEKSQRVRPAQLVEAFLSPCLLFSQHAVQNRARECLS